MLFKFPYLTARTLMISRLWIPTGKVIRSEGKISDVFCVS